MPETSTITRKRDDQLLTSMLTGLLINGEWREASDVGSFAWQKP